MRSLLILWFIVISPVSMAGQSWSMKYSMLISYSKKIASAIKQDIDEKKLTDAQVYTYLTSLVSYDNRIWSATLGFSPSFFEKGDARNWWLSDTWQSNKSRSNKALYAPYVWRSMDNLLAASDIGDISSSFGYDYTDPKWDWWSRTIQSQKPTWTGPYESSMTGHSMVTYSVPINHDAVLSFNVWYGP